MVEGPFRNPLPDPDPEQTAEWKDSILAVNEKLGPERARRLLLDTISAANQDGIDLDVVSTPYLNTIHPSQQPKYPGDLALEKKLHGIIRWNAMMMVTKANKSHCLL